MKFIELNFHNNDGKLIVRIDGIDCFYADDACKGSIVHTDSITLRVKETYEELRIKFIQSQLFENFE